jgi:hypothetical protein
MKNLKGNINITSRELYIYLHRNNKLEVFFLIKIALPTVSDGVKYTKDSQNVYAPLVTVVI